MQGALFIAPICIHRYQIDIKAHTHIDLASTGNADDIGPSFSPHPRYGRVGRGQL
jgi:hypothetical protein